jgi:medium-chain acyl-[acyl-carrier-protein] hydrolase
MHRTDVLATLTDYISREVLDGQADDLEPTTPLLEWGVLNSMEMTRLLAFLQETFHVQVPADRIVGANFKNLAAITDLVVQLDGQSIDVQSRSSEPA